MTIQQAIEKLENQRNKIDSALETLRDLDWSEINKEHHKNKAKKILKSVNNKLHWTQRPENKARIMKIARKMQRARKNLK